MLLSKTHLLDKNFDLFFLNRISLLCLKGLYGCLYLKLPSYYFYKIKNNIFLFMFLNKFFFQSFVKHLFYNYRNLESIYSVRLRARGLGFRIRKIGEYLYYFFFNYTNMFYLHIPKNVLFQWFKKKAMILTNNLFLLKILFTHILLLKKMGPYRRRGLRIPKQIIFLKKGGKKFSR